MLVFGGVFLLSVLFQCFCSGKDLPLEDEHLVELN